MDQATHNKIVSFIWGIADDVLRDLFKRGKYPDVILPMCVIRRMDAVLEPTKHKVLETIQGRVDILSKAKTLPANVDKATLEGAKTGLDSMNKAWADAQASFSSGNMADALAKANALKGQAAEIMTKLGMQAPAALKS